MDEGEEVMSEDMKIIPCKNHDLRRVGKRGGNVGYSWCRRCGTLQTMRFDPVPDCSEERPSILDEFSDLVKRSGFDVCCCTGCGKEVICIPDGQPMCEDCAKEEGA